VGNFVQRVQPHRGEGAEEQPLARGREVALALHVLRGGHREHPLRERAAVAAAAATDWQGLYITCSRQSSITSYASSHLLFSSLTTTDATTDEAYHVNTVPQ
jgi:hypothetical protein